MTSAESGILIIDFGSQYTQLIARRIRECNVYCEIFPYDIDENAIKAFNPRGIILSGGPETTTDIGTPRAPQTIFALGCPVFGICYGMQTMALQLGGKVAAHAHREFGYAEIEITDENPLLYQVATANSKNNNKLILDVWMSHGDQVTELPPNFKIIGKTLNTPIAAMADEQHKYYGVQFHPEVTHTVQGLEIIRHFLFSICACKSEWTPQRILELEIKAIKEKVGNDQVILGLSGGVDSAVVAALLHQVIGDQLICVFVDHGLLRQNEAEQVIEHMRKILHINLIHVDASQRFLSALKDITDPEEKRKIIGKLFIDEFEAVSQQYPKVKWLAQGTIYTDVIESAHANASNKAHKIKSHHNVGGLPERMKLKLLEPLYYLFKDEVRKLGLELGLPAELINRHPFPGPGLAVRILGEITAENLQILKQADEIFIDELHKHNLYHEVNQAFAVFLPIKSVGVVGDARQYAYVISLRAVVTTDFMTAHWAKLSYNLLETVSTRICNEIKNVSRVVYDISSKPPATIEWE